MNHPAYKAILESAASILDSYQEDVLVHDRGMIREFPDAPFLWFVRSTGTHLVPLGVGKIAAKEKDAVTAMWNANSSHYAWNGDDLTPVSFEKMETILEYFAPLKIQL